MARGQDVSTDQELRSREMFARGAEAYRQGRFDEAISLFQTGDRLAPRAAFSYNLAVALEARGEPARALEHYRAYLRRSPDAPDRADIADDIRRLEAVLAAQGIQQVTVDAQPVAFLSIDGADAGMSPWTGELKPGRHELVVKPAGGDAVRTDFVLPPDRAIEVHVDVPVSEVPVERPIAWTLVGFTGAAVSAGTVLGLIALDRQSELDDVCGPRSDACPAGSEGDLETFRTTRTLAYVSFGAALAGAVTAIVLFSQSDAPSPTTEVAVGPIAGASGGFVSVRSPF